MDNRRQEQIKKAYDIAAEAYAEKCFFELYDKPLDKKLYDLFFERTVNRGPVLEIGCGPGEIANYLAIKGLPVTGIDISEKMIAVARRLNPHINFETGDVFRLRFSDGEIAGVVAPYLIVNFKEEDLIPAFLEIARVCRPGAAFLISFHTGGQDLIVSDFFVSGNTIPYTYFDSAVVVRLITDAGFAIKEHIVRLPYEGEVTTRAYIFAERK